MCLTIHQADAAESSVNLYGYRVSLRSTFSGQQSDVIPSVSEWKGSSL